MKQKIKAVWAILTNKPYIIVNKGKAFINTPVNGAVFYVGKNCQLTINGFDICEQEGYAVIDIF